MTLTEKIKAEIAKTAQQPQTTEVMLWLFLVEAQHRINVALGDMDTTDPRWRGYIESAALSAMCAYLLDQLHQVDPGVATDVAWLLHEWDADGEPLADWVAEEIAKRGIDVDSLTSGGAA